MGREKREDVGKKEEEAKSQRRMTELNGTLARTGRERDEKSEGIRSDSERKARRSSSNAGTTGSLSTFWHIYYECELDRSWLRNPEDSGISPHRPRPDKPDKHRRPSSVPVVKCISILYLRVYCCLGRRSDFGDEGLSTESNKQINDY